MISIIIPLYNQSQYVGDAINSALMQNCHNEIEIIIVNDGSTDNCEVQLDYYKQFQNIKIINQKNKGLSAARNAGIEEAKYKYILPLDADDILHWDFLNYAIGRIIRNDKYIIAAQRQEFGLSKKIWKPLPAPTGADFLKSNQIDYCALFTKKLWEDISGYDEKMKDGFEDWDFWIRATGAGYSVSVIPELLFYYRKHGNSLLTHALKHRKEIQSYMRTKYKLTN